MPSNPRQGIKQKLQSSINEIERSGQKLIELSDLYKEGHPEYYEALTILISAHLDLQQGVQAFSDAV